MNLYNSLLAAALLGTYGAAIADGGDTGSPAPQGASNGVVQPPPPPPPPGSTRPEDILQEAAVPVQYNVQEFYHEHADTWPTSIKQVGNPGKPEQIKNVKVGKDGALIVTFAASMPNGLGGKSVTFTPSVQADGSISWKCSAQAVPADDFPSYCR